jgi:hypothetical protein
MTDDHLSCARALKIPTNPLNTYDPGLDLTPRPPKKWRGPTTRSERP